MNCETNSSYDSWSVVCMVIYVHMYTIISWKRAHVRYTLLCSQTRGWADICNIAPFYYEKAMLHYHNLQQDIAHQHTRPVLLAAMKFWIVGGDASFEFTSTYTYHVTMNQSARNCMQQPTARHTVTTPAAVVVEENTVEHVPREISWVCWYFWRGTTQLHTELQTSGSILMLQEKDSKLYACSYWQI